MKSRQTMFFAILSDIEPILRKIEGLNSIQYFEMGLFDHRSSMHYNSIFEITDLGFATDGDWNNGRRLLIMPKCLSLNIREVPQRKGGIKYAIDPLINPQSICLQLGGIYKAKENILVAGKVGTVSEDDFSIQLYKDFSQSIRKTFKKIEEFYVGKGAEERLGMGWRLVLDEQRKMEYDLSREGWNNF